MKLEQLTSGQTSLFPSIVDKFVKLGLSTQLLNQPKAIEAVNLASQCSGLDKPKEVIFVKSPIVGMFLAKKLDKSKNWIYPINYGSDFAYLARYYTFQQLGFTEETKPLAGLLALAKECGPVWIFENTCIVSEKPASIVLNKQGQLHNLKGPAISWSDGYGQYYVNGKFVHPNIGKRLVWYLNNRKTNDQPKFSLEKELNKYQDLNLEVGTRVSNQVWSQVYNQVHNQVYNQVHNQVFNQVRTQVETLVCNQVWALVCNQVYNQVYNQVCSQFFIY